MTRLCVLADTVPQFTFDFGTEGPHESLPLSDPTL